MIIQWLTKSAYKSELKKMSFGFGPFLVGSDRFLLQ